MIWSGYYIPCIWFYLTGSVSIPLPRLRIDYTYKNHIPPQIIRDPMSVLHIVLLPITASTFTATRLLMMLLRFGPTKIRFLLWNTSEFPSFRGQTRNRTLNRLMEQNTMDKMLITSPILLPSRSVEFEIWGAMQHLDKNPGDAMALSQLYFDSLKWIRKISVFCDYMVPVSIGLMLTSSD